MKQNYIFTCLALLIFAMYPTIISSQQFEAQARQEALSLQSPFKKSQTAIPSNYLLRLNDYHKSELSGTHHHYFVETVNGIEIYNAVVGVHLKSDGKIIKKDVPKHSKSIPNDLLIKPSISAIEAINISAKQLNLKFDSNLTQKVRQKQQESSSSRKSDSEQSSKYQNIQISKDIIPLRLVYFPSSSGQLILAWHLTINESTSTDYWSIRLDATSGKILEQNNLTYNCSPLDGGFEHHPSHSTLEKDIKPYAPSQNLTNSAGQYNVFDLPNFTPYDGPRVLVTDPHKLEASPYGWHDTDGQLGAEFTTTRGNNVNAFKVKNSVNYSPDGGAMLNFDFPLDTTYSPANPSEDAAITNVFYLLNRLHDLFYLYGFDEQSGNFQANNYGHGGLSGDYVDANVQSQSGTCNASMAFPVDGVKPTMSIYVCNDHDVAYDGGVLAHEYAHGLTGRLIGGPSISDCIEPRNGGNEGWSDYFDLITSIQPGDQGSDVREHAIWYKNATGQGGFTRKYSTDSIPTQFAPNYWTFTNVDDGYQSIHTIGLFWCTFLWDVSWALIDQYGFNSNIDAPWNTGGNNLALQLTIDALKLLPCNANFIDNRDAILAADVALTGGENQCIIWAAFAKRGLGLLATQTYINDVLTVVEDFTTPKVYTLEKTTKEVQVEPGDSITYVVYLANNSVCADTLFNVVITDTLDQNVSYKAGSASNGGTISGNVVSWTIPQINPGLSEVQTFQVTVNPQFETQPDLVLDDLEEGSYIFRSSEDMNYNFVWVPNANAHSGDLAIFGEDVDSFSIKTLTLDEPIVPNERTVMSFWHYFDTEQSYDGGRVEISTNDGQSWVDLEKNMILNGYNDFIFIDSLSLFLPGFSGTNALYKQTKIDLSSYKGQSILVRFVLSSDATVGGVGWYIDLIRIDNNGVTNKLYATSNGGTSYIVESEKVHSRIENSCHNLLVSTTADKGVGSFREVLSCANPGDTIRFSPLLDGEDINLFSEIQIFKDITIIGNGKDNTILSGGENLFDRILAVHSGANVHIENINIQEGGSTLYPLRGAGMYIDGNAQITLLNCRFLDNACQDQGGAIYMQSGLLHAINCEFMYNYSSASGSVIAVNGANTKATLDQCLIASNSSTTSTIYNNENLVLRNCTIANNTQTNAIHNLSELIMHNTIIDNPSGVALNNVGTIVVASNNLANIPGDLMIGTNGNKQGSANFVSLFDEDFRVMLPSPAIAAGDVGLMPIDVYDLDMDIDTLEKLPNDLAGNKRIYACYLDIGAYEYQKPDVEIMVHNTMDSGAESLRDVIGCAPDGSTITFDQNIDGDSINLLSGEIMVNQNLSILGNGLNNTIVTSHNGNNFRLFNVNTSNVSFIKMQLNGGGGVSYANDGAAITANDTSNIDIVECLIANNNTMGKGGAVYVDSFSTLKITNSYISQNTASEGSVVFNQGKAKIFQSVINSNTSTAMAVGCSLRNEGPDSLLVSQSTFADNHNDLTCILNDGILDLSNSIFKNTSGSAISNNGSLLTSNNLVDSIIYAGDLIIGSTARNIVGNPLFEGSGAHPYELTNLSPAIGKGNDAKIPIDIYDIDQDNDSLETISFDLKNEDRQYGCHVAIGAYEYVKNDYSIFVDVFFDGHVGALRDVINCAPDGSSIFFFDNIASLTQGEIIIDKNLNIIGNGRSTTNISGFSDVDANSRLFNILPGNTVNIQDLELNYGGGANFFDQGSSLLVQSGAQVNLKNVDINENTTHNGVISIESGAYVHAVNTRFYYNNAEHNLIENFGSLKIDQNILFDNIVSAPSGDIFTLESGSLTLIKQSTIADNSPSHAVVHVKNGALSEIQNSIFKTVNGVECANDGTLQAAYNLIANPVSSGNMPLSGNGNIVGDPKFDVNNGFQGNQYYLLPTSPAINFGLDSLIPVDILDTDNNLNFAEKLNFDIAGNPRITNCGLVDIGAFEYSGFDINLIVQNTSDSGLGSLRSLISCANDGDSIKFAQSTNANPIFLTSGEINLDKGIILKGNGIDNTIIDGINDVGDDSRLFTIKSDVSSTFSDLSLINGGGANFFEEGAGIKLDSGQVNLVGVNLSSNKTIGNGGAAHVGINGKMTILNSVLSDNAGLNGSILYNLGNATFQQCLVYNNIADSSSISSSGPSSLLELSQSTFADNTNEKAFVLLEMDANLSTSNSIYSNLSGPEVKFGNGNNSISTNYNLIDNMSNRGEFEGMIFDYSGDPKFVNPMSNDYRLLEGSSALSFGETFNIPRDQFDLDNDGISFETLPFDFDGNPRIFGCDQVDIGVYEFQDSTTSVSVRKLNDNIEGSLRAIIACAPESSTVVFWPILDGLKLKLTSGEINLDKTINIFGNGPLKTILDATPGSGSEVFRISNNANVNIENITLLKE